VSAADDDLFGPFDEDASAQASRDPLPGEFDRAVVFVDVLGFAALTEKHEIDPDVYRELQRPGAIEFLRASLETMEASPLSEQFIRFHLLVEECVHECRLVEDSAVVIFSDCAFFATERVWYAIEFAAKVVQAALDNRVPVRIGIAYGGFVVVRAKSDFGMANQDHIVQFLGSGVTRAYAAERCGVKGMRILLHPSAQALLASKRHLTMNQTLGGDVFKYRSPILLPQHERTNRCGVAMEINYLWHPRHDDRYWEHVREMRSASAPDVAVHYDATEASLNRMRAALEREPFQP
jgi:class 3 adenylate cyclase